jgi:hypothetical protein
MTRGKPCHPQSTLAFLHLYKIKSGDAGRSYKFIGRGQPENQ